MTMTAVVMTLWFVVTAGFQIAPAQSAWLRGFEGTWVVDNASGPDADIVVTIGRDARDVLSVAAAYGGAEFVTRYDLTGKDVINTAPGSKDRATFRTRIVDRAVVTEIWDGPSSGPPQRIEKRWLESPGVMVTELSKTPGGPVFNRGVLRRKKA